MKDPFDYRVVSFSRGSLLREPIAMLYPPVFLIQREIGEGFHELRSIMIS